MRDYFVTVTLGAFTWKNEARIALFFQRLKKTKGLWMVLHFLLLTVCLDFPVTFAMARLSPFELCSRLYGGNFADTLPESARAAFSGGEALNETAVNDFNIVMMENGYGKNVLLPLLGTGLVIIVIIQAMFYSCAVFFLGLARMNVSFMNSGVRFGLAVFSSTLPVLASAFLGLILPALHIIVFYFLVMFFIFERSRAYPNG